MAADESVDFVDANLVSALFFILFYFTFNCRLSRNLHEKLLLARRKIVEHRSSQRNRKMQEISKAAALARSALHKKVRHLRAYLVKSSEPRKTNQTKLVASDQCPTGDNSGNTTGSRSSTAVEIKTQSPSGISKTLMKYSARSSGLLEAKM